MSVEHNHLDISGTTKVVGIIGYPLTYTLSPRIHNYAFHKLGLDYVYLAFPIANEQDLGAVVDSLRHLNIVGVNVTMPYKEKIMQHLDQLNHHASLLKAVNTVIHKNGVLHGDNTDINGVLNSLNDIEFDLSNKNILLIGTGGMAISIAKILDQHQVRRVTILHRSPKSFAKIQDNILPMISSSHRFRCIDKKDLHSPLDAINKYIENVDLIINTIPITDLPCQLHIKNKNTVIMDVVYHIKTPFYHYAKTHHLSYISGLSILAYQGAVAFSLWTGFKPPIDYMKEALNIG